MCKIEGDKVKKLFFVLMILSLVVAVTNASETKKFEDNEIRSRPLLHSVHDLNTDLWWEDTVLSGTQELTWEDALAYCESLELDFFTEWRLPNIFELASISVTLNNWGDGQKRYWSSTTYPHTQANAMVYLYDPTISYRHRYTKSKREFAYVRCVK